ncbi:MAG TPA: ornithine cyclodeaminase family protein [Pyrinomonadaceae bacterium]|jgi:ornithine cyclodeaminase/alanine dehydrogenase-like protein (mu-crystallin family)|nr:ornithine cyclodeaminase family protein [Pyrinomonadaceae bacterium]
MKILILNHDEVVQLLPMKECIELMREALIQLTRGEVHQPLRTIVRPAGAKGVMGLMPSYVGGEQAAYGLKTVCVFPGNPAQGKDAHQGAVMLFSAETGELLALMNASAITAIRTAAVSGVATDLLARKDARNLAIVGAGVQARTHLIAMSEVRPIQRCRVVSRAREHATRFVDEMSGRVSFAIEPVESVREAVAGADVIATVTSAKEPVVERGWLSAGAHLNVLGSSTPNAREVDTATMVASSLFVDRRESTINEAGDYLAAAREGAIGPDHIRAELGEVLTGAKPGRTSADEITLFKSLGLAVEDLAAANYLYRKAKELNTGVWVEFD